MFYNLTKSNLGLLTFFWRGSARKTYLQQFRFYIYDTDQKS